MADSCELCKHNYWPQQKKVQIDHPLLAAFCWCCVGSFPLVANRSCFFTWMAGMELVMILYLYLGCQSSIFHFEVGFTAVSLSFWISNCDEGWMQLLHNWRKTFHFSFCFEIELCTCSIPSVSTSWNIPFVDVCILCWRRQLEEPLKPEIVAECSCWWLEVAGHLSSNLSLPEFCPSKEMMHWYICLAG